jgi:hypothetical protein
MNHLKNLTIQERERGIYLRYGLTDKREFEFLGQSEYNCYSNMRKTFRTLVYWGYLSQYENDILHAI